MSERMVCVRCPECGYKGYEKIPPQGIGFGKDRQCDKCGTKYTPPANPVAAIAMTVIGGVAALAVAGLVVVVGMRQLASDSPEALVGPCAWILPVMVGVIGTMLLVGGLKALRQKPVEPPEYQAPPPRLPTGRGR